jgi:hypothetical protein
LPRFFDFGFCLAWAKSEPATDLTVGLLLVRSSLDAFEASRFDVVIDFALSD